jgi:hypothetical protein
MDLLLTLGEKLKISGTQVITRIKDMIPTPGRLSLKLRKQRNKTGWLGQRPKRTSRHYISSRDDCGRPAKVTRIFLNSLVSPSSLRAQRVLKLGMILRLLRNSGNKLIKIGVVLRVTGMEIMGVQVGTDPRLRSTGMGCLSMGTVV